MVIETRGDRSYLYVVAYDNPETMCLSFVSAQVRADSLEDAYARGLDVGLEDELQRQGFNCINSYAVEVH